MPKYGINKAILVGNVGSDPDLRYTQQGVAICSFRLATTERRPAADNSWKDITDWHTITLWRKKAELAHKTLRKGSGVYIEGRISNRSWEGQDGQKRYSTEIEVDKIRLLDPAPRPAQPPQNAPSSPQAAPAAEKQPPANPEAKAKTATNQQEEEDDLPF